MTAEVSAPFINSVAAQQEKSIIDISRFITSKDELTKNAAIYTA